VADADRGGAGRGSSGGAAGDKPGRRTGCVAGGIWLQETAGEEVSRGGGAPGRRTAGEEDCRGGVLPGRTTGGAEDGRGSSAAAGWNPRRCESESSWASGSGGRWGTIRVGVWVGVGGQWTGH
jgi:hypothetical protein